MSPAFTARFAWYPKLPGNRQIGRSIHFLVMCAFVVFVIGHVTMVALTGFVRNMNHIVVGTDNTNPIGLYLGLAGIGVVVLLNVFANWMAWRHPRTVQHAAKAIVSPVMGFLLDRATPRAEFDRADISPFFWVNGKMPTCDEWKTLVAGDFKDYRLKVYGLVENPVDLSLDDLRALGQKSQITLHHCIQGWSGIAEWGGLPLADTDEAGPARTQGPRRSSSTRLARGSSSTRVSRAANTTTASRSRTLCTRKHCWRTR